LWQGREMKVLGREAREVGGTVRWKLERAQRGKWGGPIGVYA